jgi:Zn-dependent peptidase ImmA (M78 family)
MKLTSQDILKIEAIVTDILQEFGYDLTNPKSIPFPIDLKAIAEKYGLKIKMTEFPDDEVSGLFNRNDKEIIVSSKEPYNRQIFTIAHELAHFFLHKSKEEEVLFRKTLTNPDDTNQKIEAEANWFAASLLIPKEYLKLYWRFFPDINEIANLFGVSNIAAYWRIHNLEKEGVI